MPANNVCLTAYFSVSLQNTVQQRPLGAESLGQIFVGNSSVYLTWFKLISIAPIAVVFFKNKKEMIVVPHGMTIKFPCACLFDR